MKYFIKTYGCQQNVADSERVASYYESRGYTPAADMDHADLIVLNTCMVREMAEERVYGMVKKLEPYREKKPGLKIVITGCLVGTALREPTGKVNRAIRKRMPHVELLPIEDVGFEHHPKRGNNTHGWVPITHGCNNYCTFCIVPFARGKEISRPFEEIVTEVEQMVADGFSQVTLLGQNVNSYGSDLVKAQKGSDEYVLPTGEKIPTTMVSHLGRTRIPTLFPQLLKRVAEIDGLKRVMFTSSNPWDYSDALIDVIASHENIYRELHLPVQSGDDEVLRRMNRWYTKKDYVALVNKIKEAIPGVQFTTDIIVGFPGETNEQFENTVQLCKEIGFRKSFTAWYSPRPGTVAAQQFEDDVPYEEKKRRWYILDEVVNGRDHSQTLRK